MHSKHILVTGPPRCGKSMLIERVVHKIEKPLTGFFTREIKKHGKRVGFSIITMDGQKGVLAHQDIRSRPKVGKYGVNLHDIDHIAVLSMIPTKPDEIIVIDEIGKMECLSPLFRQTLVKILDTKHQVIGSIAQKGDRFIQKIKERNNIMLFEISEKNRDKLADSLITTLSF